MATTLHFMTNTRPGWSQCTAAESCIGDYGNYLSSLTTTLAACLYLCIQFCLILSIYFRMVINCKVGMNPQSFQEHLTNAKECTIYRFSIAWNSAVFSGRYKRSEELAEIQSLRVLLVIEEPFS